MKKLLALFISLLFITPVFAQETLKDFEDVPAGHPNYDAILLLRYNGVLEGYEDNTFRPDNLINRVEALKLAFEVSGLEIQQGVAPASFTDTAIDAWYSPYLNQAVFREIVQGYPDNTYKPEQNVNLVEFLKLLLLAQEVDLSDVRLAQIPYADTMPGQWYTKYTDFAAIHTLVDADNANKIYPAHFITRAEAAEIIYRFGKLDLSEAPAEDEETITPESSDEPTYSDDDMALYVSETYSFAVQYPKYWFYSGEAGEEGITRVYKFGPDDLTENDPLVVLKLKPSSEEIPAGTSESTVESTLTFTRHIEGDRIYEISGPEDQRDNMLAMIVSITNTIEGLETFNPAESTEETPTEENPPAEDPPADETPIDEGQADTSDPDAI